MFSLKNIVTQGLNVDYNGVIIRDVAEKIGSVFGQEGRRIGKKIDDVTKKITIKTDTK